jgi:hypothetical protein
VAADAALLAGDFLGVYSSGFAGRSDHTDQLHDGPTVSSYELSDARLVELSTDVVLLAYRASYTRPGAEAGTGRESMYVASVWQRRDRRWRNVFSQDTAAED